MRHSRQDGFSVIEAIVSFAITALVLVSVYKAIAGGYHGAALVKQRRLALAHAGSQLASLGITKPLRRGMTQGTLADNTHWNLEIDPLGRPVQQGNKVVQAYWVRLRVFDRRGRAIIDLRTIKLTMEQPDN